MGVQHPGKYLEQTWNGTYMEGDRTSIVGLNLYGLADIEASQRCDPYHLPVPPYSCLYFSNLANY